MENPDSKIENGKKLRDATLVFLIKKSQGKISEVCLAMKKRGFGVNRWNGTGGKVEKGENIKTAATRETMEEIGVEIKQTNKVAELSFFFPHNPAWDQKVHVYFSESWNGEPTESEEMRPQWFSPLDLPFDSMWPDDQFWLPEVFVKKLIKATFVFGENDIIKDKEINIVDEL
ncbi:MAG: 8-oxo-dGTP diphosphatase [Candidatus Zambryskibacteria bacterium]|nr:8-oxo-dGTP diphosphatase [Candidatus Zambryskibacteria bacterium]